jgi:hypothetical protein
MFFFIDLSLKSRRNSVIIELYVPSALVYVVLL